MWCQMSLYNELICILFPVWRKKNIFRGHTDLNHGPIGLQPIALPLSYIPDTSCDCKNLGGNVDCLYYTSVHVPVRHLVARCVIKCVGLLCWHRKIFDRSVSSVGGIMVSIAAFQAVDPGSIPGRRSNFWNIKICNLSYLRTLDELI